MSNSTPPLATIHEIRDSCLCLASQRAARAMARRFDRAFAPLGITNGQFSLMMALAGQWQPRLGQLAEFLAMDATTVTAAVKTLERNGMIRLQPDEADARARRPVLTDQGRAVLVQAVPIWREEHERVAEALDGLDAVQLARDLSHLR